MFILPPPPKYPVYSTVPLVTRQDTIDLAAKTEANSQHLLSSDGVYKGRDVVVLTNPGTHPNEIIQAVPTNPLAPSVFVPAAHQGGAKITFLKSLANGPLVSHHSQNQQPGSKARAQSNGSGKSWTSALLFSNGRRPSVALTEDTVVSSYGERSKFEVTTGVGAWMEDSGKKKRPKTSLTKNNSSFISKAAVTENLTKKLAEISNTGSSLIWLNYGRSFNWLDLNLNVDGFSRDHVAVGKKEELSKILFTKSLPLCHDLNLTTRSAQSMDLVLGMSTGDAIWLDAVTNKYNRLNKNGDTTRSAVMAVKWIPGSATHFVTLHANGELIIFDREREDGGFASKSAGSGGPAHHRSTETFQVIKSLYDNSVTDNKSNPVAMYKLSHRPLTSITFSPVDGSKAVLTCADGFMRFIDFESECITDICTSYFDGLQCCAFSPDARYLATGGNDDMVTVWDVEEKRPIARGVGHASWVRAVQFDDWNWTDGTTYRLGSVADDGTLIFWDFSPKITRKQRSMSASGDFVSGSVAASPVLTNSSGTFGVSPGSGSKYTNGSVITNGTYSGSTIGTGNGMTGWRSETTNFHGYVKMEEVKMMTPMLVKKVKPDEMEFAEGLSDLMFMENCVLASGKDGRIWRWDRPLTENLM